MCKVFCLIKILLIFKIDGGDPLTHFMMGMENSDIDSFPTHTQGFGPQ